MTLLLITTIAATLLVKPEVTVQPRTLAVPIVLEQNQSVHQSQPEVFASRELSLDNRHQTERINEVFRKNILLNLAYLNQSVTSKNEIDWTQVEQPTSFRIQLLPGETFAYHDDVLAEYESTLAVTTRAHFDSREGFLSSGFLYGDGVCHLASILNWAAQDAGLGVNVTKKHSIAKIPDIPDEYGVSIYTQAGIKGSGARNNLYITNTKTTPIEFIFEYQSNNAVVVTVQSA